MAKRYGVKGNGLKWFRSYLQDRKQSVMIDGTKSEMKDLRYGVSQGSVLGPILFLLYTSPVGDIIKRHGLNCHLCADDTQLYLSFKPTYAEQRGSIAKIEGCVSEIDSWMVCNLEWTTSSISYCQRHWSYLRRAHVTRKACYQYLQGLFFFPP